MDPLYSFSISGHWLEESGWTYLLTLSTVVTAGKANAMLNASSNIMLCRYLHQVTACVLYKLRKKAYDAFKLREGSEDITEQQWITTSEKAPLFKYWNLTLQIELILLEFVKSIRSGDFNLYVQSLRSITPWMFALNHHNYARWLPIHIRTMINLPVDIKSHFLAGRFSVQKTNRKFSRIGLDHNHEQLNSTIKGVGGAIGLTGSDASLKRWVVTGPEISRLLEEFETTNEELDAPSSTKEHHDANKTSQKNFREDINKLVKAFNEFGNPFEDNSQDLVSIGTNIIMDKANTENLFKVESAGEQQFLDYWKDRIVDRKVPVSDTISKNKFHIFTSTKREATKVEKKLKMVKNNVALFSRLFISCQTRNGDLNTFFSHENQPTPPSLSENHTLRLPKKKSEIIQILCSDEEVHEAPEVDAKIMDGAAVINMLRPQSGKTFQDYAQNTFVPYMVNMLKDVMRLDVVWDRYFENSLKICTRQKRGAGVRRKVAENGSLPSNWQTFLRCNENKKELFPFLSKMLVKGVTQKLVVATEDENVITNREFNTTSMEPCNFEEADERIFVHLKNISNDFPRVLIKTVDSDVVVIAISIFHKVVLRELWIEFGTGKSLRFIPVHEVAINLGAEKCYALPFFNAFSGCDTTSAMSGKGKKAFYNTWMAMYDEITPLLTKLSTISSRNEIEQEDFELIEAFVVSLYSKTCNTRNVNEARKILFSRDSRSIENIPPTNEALVQHILRSVLQASKWHQCLNKQHDSRDPCLWGWKRLNENEMQPFWTTLPEASSVCRELIKCGCKKGCTGNCKCRKAALECTELCQCSGQCTNI